MSPLSVFCLPCAGASAGARFASWTRIAPPGLRIVATELPGRGERSAEFPMERLEPLAADLADRIARSAGTAPFALFGHSFGALLGYECAHRLRDRFGLEPAAIIVACCGAPTTFDNSRYRRRWTREELEREFVSLNPQAAEVLDHAGLADLLIRQMDHDFQVIGDMGFDDDRPKLTCPVIVLAGADDELTAAELAGWADTTRGASRVALFPGGHFFFDRRPEVVLEHVTFALGRGELATSSLEAAN